MEKPRILIDGPISSGKTTLVKSMEAEGFLPLIEPVTKRHKDFFYADPAKRGVVFDLLLVGMRAMDWIVACETVQRKNLRGLVADRWPMSARVFLESYMENSEDFNLLTEVMERIRRDLLPPTHVVILRCPVQELQRRLRPRTLMESAESERDGVTDAYLAKLEEGYERYAQWMRHNYPNATVVFMDSLAYVTPTQVLGVLGLSDGH